MLPGLTPLGGGVQLLLALPLPRPITPVCTGGEEKKRKMKGRAGRSSVSRCQLAKVATAPRGRTFTRRSVPGRPATWTPGARAYRLCTCTYIHTWIADPIYIYATAMTRRPACPARRPGSLTQVNLRVNLRLTHLGPFIPPNQL